MVHTWVAFKVGFKIFVRPTTCVAKLGITSEEFTRSLAITSVLNNTKNSVILPWTVGSGAGKCRVNTDACLSTAVSGKRDVYCMLVRTSDVLLVAFTDDSVHCNKPTSILHKYARNMLLAEVVEDEMDFHLNYVQKPCCHFLPGQQSNKSLKHTICPI